MTNATAQRFFDEVWSHGKLDLVDELFAAEYIGHPSGPEETVRGPRGRQALRRPSAGRRLRSHGDRRRPGCRRRQDRDAVDGPGDARRRAARHPGRRGDRPASRESPSSSLATPGRSSKAGRTGTCSGCSISSASHHRREWSRDESRGEYRHRPIARRRLRVPRCPRQRSGLDVGGHGVGVDGTFCTSGGRCAAVEWR